MLRNNKHHNCHLQFAWNKYGEKAFKFEIVKECKSLEELNESEISLIKTGGDLYNLAPGGNAFIHDIKTKKAIGEANKKPVVGMNIKTGEVKEYASAADAKVDGFDDKCVRKCATGFISKTKQGSPKSISHRGWVWISKEEFSLEKLQEKREESKRAKIRKERPIIGMNVFTNEIITFRSCSEASKNGFGATNVYRACREFSVVHKGFVWAFVDIEDPQSLLKDKKAYVLSKVRTGPKSWQYKDEHRS